MNSALALNKRQSGASLDRVRTWLNDRCGMTFDDHKIESLELRLNRIVAEFGLDHIGELALELESGERPEIQDATIRECATNHTFFFREPEVLEYFKTKILQPLLNGTDEIRIWSAAASRGPEAYTLAIIASELMGARAARERVKILGTDISAPVIAAAEHGTYADIDLEVTPGELRDRYFRKLAGGQYEVTRELKEMCMFRRLNLTASPYPFRTSFDIVFCRNVLYYFDRTTQSEVLGAIHDVTKPNGWLVTSVTVSIRDLTTQWNTLTPGIHRRRK